MLGLELAERHRRALECADSYPNLNVDLLLVIARYSASSSDCWPIYRQIAVILLRVQNFPIRLEDPRLNWVPGSPPTNPLMLTYMLYAALWPSSTSLGRGEAPQPVSVSPGYVVQ